jgi:osmotically-inducible protein OsmY
MDLMKSGVMLLALGAVCGCVYAQNPQAAAPSAEAITACTAGLAAQVKAALHAAPGVNDMHIDVYCEKRRVVLTGLVESQRAMLDAMQVATKAAQGHPVTNALSIMKVSPH